MAYFVPTPAGLEPVPEARSPWAADMLHGRLLAGLAARAIEQDAGAAEFRVARLTVDMFRSPPMLPFATATRVVRDGRRVRAVDVSITSGDREVARASAVQLRTGPHPDARVWGQPSWTVPSPDELAPPDVLMAPGGWDIRLITPGGFWAVEQKRLWARDGWALVQGEEMSPLVRVAIAADLPNPMANAGADGLQFINADLTLTIARLPRTEWVGLEVTDHVAADGIAIGRCAMFDVDGPIGSSTVCAVTNAPLDLSQEAP